MKVSEPIYDITNCTKKMEHVDKDRNLCAGGSSKGGFGTCNGDSGGPLQCQSSNGKWYQIGITSWGEPCAHPDFPDVFTRVAFFHDWIEKILDEN
jgi:secreted trypsin-like serine protease